MALIAGTLNNASGVRPNTKIILTAYKTTSDVVMLAPDTTIITSAKGAYSFECKPSFYNVRIQQPGYPCENVGIIQVYSDSVTGTINDFLTVFKPDDLTPEILKQCITAMVAAETAAKNAADDATDFIQQNVDAWDKTFDAQFSYKYIKSFTAANAASEKITEATKLNAYSKGTAPNIEWWGLIQSTTIPVGGLPIPAAPDDNWGRVDGVSPDEVYTDMASQISKTFTGYWDKNTTYTDIKTTDALWYSAVGQLISPKVDGTITTTDTFNPDNWILSSLVTLPKLYSVLVDPRNFGVVGDYILPNGTINPNPTDDTDALQKWLAYSHANYSSIRGVNLNCKTSSTLYIGNYPDSVRPVTLDFGGMTLYPTDDVMIAVDSGELINGVWTSTWDTPLDRGLTHFVTLTNLKAEGSSDKAKNGRLAYRFKDWHYQTEFKHLGCRNFEFGYSFRNCYAMEVDSCSIFNTNNKNKIGKGFQFEGGNNLIKLHRLTAANMAQNYQMSGEITAVVMDNCSFEASKSSLKIIPGSVVYNLSVVNSYIEGVETVAFDIQDYCNNFTLGNNYINFSKPQSALARIFDYKPSKDNNIRYLANNDFTAPDLSKDPLPLMFKTVDPTLGYNRVYIELPDSNKGSIDDYIIDNTDVPVSATVNATVGTNERAKVVNGYAVAQYAGKYSDGVNSATGFRWQDSTDTRCVIDTRIVPSSTCRIAIALKITDKDGGIKTVVGDWVGSASQDSAGYFYEYTSTGYATSKTLTAENFNGYFRFTVTGSATTVVGATGEIRL